MPTDPAPIVFTDRSGSDETWTYGDFFAEGLARSVLAFQLEGVTTESLEPFAEAGLNLDGEELARDTAVIVAGGAGLVDDALPQLAHLLLEELTVRIPDLLSELDIAEGETREQRSAALFWAGWFSGPEAIAALAREVRRIIAT